MLSIVRDALQGVKAADSGDEPTKLVFGVADPSANPGHSGWPLRNFLVLIAVHFGKGKPITVEVVALRETVRLGKSDLSTSLVLEITVPAVNIDVTSESAASGKETPHHKGLEKDAKGLPTKHQGRPCSATWVGRHSTNHKFANIVAIIRPRSTYA